MNLNKYFDLLPQYFGSWEEAWKSRQAPQGLGISSVLWEKYLKEKSQIAPLLLKEELQKKGIKIITKYDPLFPKLVLQIQPLPCILYYCGNPALFNSNSLAVIGSRKATQYGLSQAVLMSSQLAGYGLTIVSGLARGIDSAAHQGALDAGGNTVAVLGSGLDVVYPRENARLYQEIKEKGLVVSEYPPGTGPLKQNFPIRNRIISGMSRGVFVIEAQAASGTLITCDYALEQGKDVFALPGPVTSPNSIGTLRLIQQGAKLVIYPEDILEELGLSFKQELFAGQKKKAQQISLAEKQVLDFFCWEPVHIDKLLADHADVESLFESLASLEIKGLIKQLPGKYYVRI